VERYAARHRPDPKDKGRGRMEGPKAGGWREKTMVGLKLNQGTSGHHGEQKSDGTGGKKKRWRRKNVRDDQVKGLGCSIERVQGETRAYPLKMSKGKKKKWGADTPATRVKPNGAPRSKNEHNKEKHPD